MGTRHDTYFFCLSILLLHTTLTNVDALACNWGTQASHPIPPNIVVKLLRDNGFNKVKLFEADPGALRALGKSGIQVMVGIPNDLLATMASTVTAAERWVQQNVSQYISKYGTDIRHVAVGNEPFLKTYKDRFVRSTYPALQNVQAALVKAGLGRQVKVTVPLNADVYESGDGLPSSGDFRSDIKTLMVSIVRFLADSLSPITFNIYPFLSLNADPNFPREYAFFPGGGGAAKPVVDGSISYTNVFDANFDTLVSALEKNGFDANKVEIIVGEVGWPTDGDTNATPAMAQRFNQGLLNRIVRGQGTPRRKTAPEVYIFSLVDEDVKSIDPGKFERHWGIFSYDGAVKYPLSLGNGRQLVPAKGVRYQAREWCVLSPQAAAGNGIGSWTSSVEYACQLADCTSLGPGSSCAALDPAANASYAFNMYFQKMDHRRGSCVFDNLGFVTKVDPSRGSCRFPIEIDTSRHETLRPPPSPPRSSGATGIKWRTVAAAAMLVGWAVFN
ncbi:O-Glycosyl hydrolases family 17 protein [Raphanus sativus]|uniref:glucan endo-1,3-beta-D-glucosidase n=1 Tax=Raphanus sativus TaxID=3726 RepID=A0A6J0LNV1_RAPSA|nr:glucan endo-1,3-beta-glucosidase 5-like [Raphanus sativus]KAJ4910847.1 O-Glycosyl hydrolases family 17 protein [Raphanus sativus]